ncbi:flavocytochrome c [Alkalibacter mobilis]|uniref:flavocytochrome c n=1 Tax=Alkalibacter mobilis TaxID=2787712 RepID=UPI00189D73FB|nr:flavocytochrome c [Alkalibacter mobilis]MBF7097655.1 flavocytochrome c [Alkalibacter mobilis]
MKKIIALILLITLLFSIVGCQSTDSDADEIFTPGTYEGEGTGINGKIKLAVTVDESQIKTIDITEHNETAGVSDSAFEKLPAEIIEYQTVALDTVTGATYSSNGILEAVKMALLAAGASEEDITKAPTKKDVAGTLIEKTADVIVIGTGGAGMSAAADVIKSGGTVILIDKMPSVGGNTILAGSAMNAADPEIQKTQEMPTSQVTAIEELLALEPKDEYMAKWQEEIGADMKEYKAKGSTYLYDSPALHKLQTYAGGDYVGNPKLIDIYGDNALDAVNYLKDLGTEWGPNILSAVGSTWVRSHQPEKSSGSNGSSFVLPQLKYVEDNGGEILLEHKAEEIIVENGRVVGVKGTTSDGTPFDLRGNKGVILATGGFAANVEMRQEYNEHWANLDETVHTSNPSSSTGDGIIMAEAIGANLIDMEWIQLVTGSGKGTFTASILNNIYVNVLGERFVNEDARRDHLSQAVLSQPKSIFWLLTDGHTVIDTLGGYAVDGTLIEDRVDNQQLFKADTIEDLATQIGMDPAVLQKTIDQYNDAVVNGNDLLGRKVFDQKFDKPPYYAGIGLPVVHHTMGGVEINENAQVIDTSGKPIPGFYAAGEVTGGIHGSNRLGGNAITDIIVFGRIAGDSIMK